MQEMEKQKAASERDEERCKKASRKMRTVRNGCKARAHNASHRHAYRRGSRAARRDFHSPRHETELVRKQFRVVRITETEVKTKRKDGLDNFYHACRVTQRTFHGPVRPFKRTVLAFPCFYVRFYVLALLFSCHFLQTS